MKGFLGAVLASSLAPLVASGQVPPTTSATLVVSGDAATDAAIAELTKPIAQVLLPAVPVAPVQTLINALNAHSFSLGHAVDHSQKVNLSGINEVLAGRIAVLVEAMMRCTAAARLSCAVDTHNAAVAVIRTPSLPFKDIDAWPTLYVDGNGGNDFYRFDYSVLVDRGGRDIYDNNAGGNLQDVKNGPRGSTARNQGQSAIGCEQVQGNFPAPTAGGVLDLGQGDFAPNSTGDVLGHDCIAAPQVVFIDQGTGDDVYGLFKPPRRADHNVPVDPTTLQPGPPRRVDGTCTNDWLVRRMVLQGSGFEGNGLLIDEGGNDWYNGKTAAQGSGHVGGVGVQRDLGGGRDHYLAARNSQGFALVGILGLLHDDGGNDRFGTYMPRPKDPNAAFQTDGSGGVIDDTGICDNLERMVQGAALAGGVGVLVNEGGNDVYRGATPNDQQFNPNVTFTHSSQGFGCATGIGVMTDTGRGRDIYINGPGRANGVTRTEPETACGTVAAPGVGLFTDDG